MRHTQSLLFHFSSQPQWHFATFHFIDKVIGKSKKSLKIPSQGDSGCGHLKKNIGSTTCVSIGFLLDNDN